MHLSTSFCALLAFIMPSMVAAKEALGLYTGWEVAMFFVIIFMTTIVILISLCCLCKSMMIVQHSEVVIKEKCGKYTATLKPGFHWLWPFCEHPRSVNWRYLDAMNNSSQAQVRSIVTDHIDTREHVIDFGRQTVSLYFVCRLDTQGVSRLSCCYTPPFNPPNYPLRFHFHEQFR